MGELAEWSYCPRCGEPIGGDAARPECGACGFVAYASAKPTACAVVVDGYGRVLLARRRNEPFAGRWDLPGGFLDETEHPLDALRRELTEETGLEVEPDEFLGVWMDRYPYDGGSAATLNLYWSARVVAGDANPADDVSELRWFAANDLPAAGEMAFHIPEVLSAWRRRDEDA